MEKTLTRTATAMDLKVGILLFDSEGYPFMIIRKYDEGVWEGRGNSGDKVILESEAHFYKVKIS